MSKYILWENYFSFARIPLGSLLKNEVNKNYEFVQIKHSLLPTSAYVVVCCK